MTFSLCASTLFYSRDEAEIIETLSNRLNRLKIEHYLILMSKQTNKQTK